MSVSYRDLGNMGRCGNQLFQISACIGYAREHDMPYIIPAWKYAQYFEGEFNQSLNVSEYQRYSELNFHYDPIPELHDVDLYGYFQSLKYWSHCQEEIKQLFTFKKEIRDKVFADWKDVLTDTPVFIHVRRGDYLNLSDYLPVLPMSYYNEAMNWFPLGTQFIVCSDDINWCRQNFSGSAFLFADMNEVETLCLMSMCTGGAIIANSSFSWWGAYLSGANRVIAPKNWFGTRANHDTKDLLPNDWITV
jgi:hypothetical protein